MHMRYVFACLVAAVPLSACAMQQERMVETGVPRGALAVAAIDSGNLTLAEHQLANSSLGSEDPARLINLGTVYMRQGRMKEAAAAWQEALAAPSRIVATATGHLARTDDLARTALARIPATPR
jgi:cytochrome c-type biogenesis protein CcmH/NrfG